MGQVIGNPRAWVAGERRRAFGSCLMVACGPAAPGGGRAGMGQVIGNPAARAARECVCVFGWARVAGERAWAR